jgi:hypothetical protein
MPFPKNGGFLLLKSLCIKGSKPNHQNNDLVVDINYQKGAFIMPSDYTKPNGVYNGKQKTVVDPTKFLFNIDTLYFTIDAPNYNQVMDQGFLEQLEQGRDQYFEAETENDFSEIHVIVPDYEHPISFQILIGQRPHYMVQMRSQDMAFYFVKRKKDNQSHYPIKVQIGQHKLWEKGVLGAYAEALSVLQYIGFDTGNAKVNRLDMCVHSDQWTWNYRDLKMFNYISGKPNFMRLDPKTDEYETVYFGDRSRLQLRIYNKSKEIKSNNKFYFNEIYERNGIRTDKVWNIEFEIHRDYLKTIAGPNGETDYFDDIENSLSQEGLSHIWTHLVRDKFLLHDKKDKHSPNSFWKVLQEGDPDKFTVSKDFIIRTKDIDASQMREVAQIYGRLMKLGITSNVEQGKELIECLKIFFEKVPKLELDKEKNFSKIFTARRLQYQDKKINGLLSPDQKRLTELNKINRKHNINRKYKVNLDVKNYTITSYSDVLDDNNLTELFNYVKQIQKVSNKLDKHRQKKENLEKVPKN